MELPLGWTINKDLLTHFAHIKYEAAFKYTYTCSFYSRDAVTRHEIQKLELLLLFTLLALDIHIFWVNLPFIHLLLLFSLNLQPPADALRAVKDVTGRNKNGITLAADGAWFMGRVWQGELANARRVQK